MHEKLYLFNTNFIIDFKMPKKEKYISLNQFDINAGNCKKGEIHI